MCANQQSEQQYSTDGKVKENNACHVLSCSDGDRERERVCFCVLLFQCTTMENKRMDILFIETAILIVSVSKFKHVHGSAWNAEYIHLNIALNFIISSWS